MQVKRKQPAANRGSRQRISATLAEHDPSLSDVAARAIIDRVLSGRCVPGQRLTEGDLARELKVGRGTIREALKRLTAERVVALIPHRGAFVRALSRDEVLQLQDVVKALYGMATSLAAAQIDWGDNRKRLTVAYERLCAGGPQSDRILHAIDRGSFYDVIFSICGNRELLRVNPAVLIQILRMQVHPFLSADELQELFSDYRLLYDAIMDGDGKKAARVFEQHIRRRRTQLERLPGEAFADESGQPR